MNTKYVVKDPLVIREEREWSQRTESVLTNVTTVFQLNCRQTIENGNTSPVAGNSCSISYRSCKCVECVQQK